LDYKSIIKKSLDEFTQDIGRFPVSLCLAVERGADTVRDSQGHVRVKGFRCGHLKKSPLRLAIVSRLRYDVQQVKRKFLEQVR